MGLFHFSQSNFPLVFVMISLFYETVKYTVSAIDQSILDQGGHFHDPGRDQIPIQGIQGKEREVFFCRVFSAIEFR